MLPTADERLSNTPSTQPMILKTTTSMVNIELT